MPPTVYLVSGSNRGIGLGLVKELAKRENAVIFAGARKPSDAHALQALAGAHPGKVHVLEVVSGGGDGNERAVAQIREKAGRLDVVIANAGINNWMGPAVETPFEQLRDHFEVNVIGTFVLFQACYKLLKASGTGPKFVIISSGGGSIANGAAIPFKMLPYGLSKAAENYLARKLHFEYAEDGLVVFPICPGGVATDMASLLREHISSDNSAEEAAMYLKAIDEGYKSAEETAIQLLARADEATRENSGGQFVNFDGGRLEW